MQHQVRAGEAQRLEAAQRALDEATQRRAGYEAAESQRPPEKGGRGGREPVRYGDWEVKGLASDF